MVNRILGQCLAVKDMHDQSVTAKGFCYFIGKGWTELDMDMVSALRCFGEGACRCRGIVNTLACRYRNTFERMGTAVSRLLMTRFACSKDASDKQHSWDNNSRCLRAVTRFGYTKAYV
mmetsp:Transcript_28150/g.28542  ORF Transcript_28150/g.28542 Transcript_28150/m.28542 type:complete len:118 (-) Transcript_28150:2859-3212(-)